jgi:threonine/homoserine/homoserine lactone efflux protein
LTAGSLLVFAVALLVAGIIPGPATMTILARVLAQGPRGVAGFCLGLVLGDLVWLYTAALGLSAVAAQAGPALRVLTYAGALYLLVLARAFWTAPVLPGTAQARPGFAVGKGIAQGLLLQLGNPKVVLFYVALLPALLPLGRLTVADLALLAVVVTGVIAVVNSVYVGFAVAVRRHVDSPRSLRAMHRLSACVMTVAAGFLAWSGYQA